ncbi:MAG: DHH family phosphoesterase [bacterium]
MKKILDEILEIFSNQDSFVISGHERPDGDCVGTQISLGILLGRMDKKFHLVNPDLPAEKFNFLPNFEWFATTPPGYQADVGIITDCGNLDRLGDLQNYLLECDLLINIDHHPGNNISADINLVSSDVSSVGELIYHLYTYAGEEITPEVALALYITLLTDTGCFQHANTGAETHRIAGELINKGDFEPYRVYSLIYERELLNSLHLLGAVLTDVKEKDGIVWGEITRDLLEKTGAGEEDLRGAINHLRQAKNCEVAVLFCERDEHKVKVSFRAKNSFDLLPVVASFGGGGHSGAAGATLEGNLGEVEEKVISVLKRALEDF